METLILLIEDDPAIQTGLKEMLDLENYKTIVCSDGREGLDTALKENPDLVLLDISLPGMSGFDVCRKLREKNFHNPVIMLTSRSEQMDKILGLELGANDYVTKPFDSRELLARIHTQLRSREKLREGTYMGKKATGESAPRRLLAVMFTDIKDYTKMMEANEDRAVGLLERHNDIMTQTIRLHEGRIKEIIGDAYVVAFESALKSVQCACEIQERFKTYNVDAEPGHQIEVRI
jgi:DNA-binding response OmpR family regulator